MAYWIRCVLVVFVTWSTCPGVVAVCSFVSSVSVAHVPAGSRQLESQAAGSRLGRPPKGCDQVREGESLDDTRG